MDTQIVQIPRNELEGMIESIVERKLKELFGDPDEGLLLTESMHDRLLRQKEAVDEGERGEAFDIKVTVDNKT